MLTPTKKQNGGNFLSKIHGDESLCKSEKKYGRIKKKVRPMHTQHVLIEKNMNIEVP